MTMNKHPLVAKVIIFPAAYSTFLKAEKGCRPRDISIDISPGLHHCFPGHVLSIRSRNISSVLHVLEEARDLNRIHSFKPNCVILLSLESADRLYRSMKDWSVQHEVSLICMRRADVLSSLPERWLIIGGGAYRNIGACLETVVRGSAVHYQMKFQVDYSTFTPLREEEITGQIRRAERKSSDEEYHQTKGKRRSKKNSSHGQGNNQQQIYKPSEEHQSIKKKELLQNLSKTQQMLSGLQDEGVSSEPQLPRRPQTEKSKLSTTSTPILCGREWLKLGRKTQTKTAEGGAVETNNRKVNVTVSANVSPVSSLEGATTTDPRFLNLPKLIPISELK